MGRHALSRRAESHPGHRAVAGGVARAAVFGVSDGLVSNVSLVIGFASSGVNADVVRLGGLAGAIAGAASMAAGEWVSISAQNELIEREIAVERRELEHNTQAETDELAAMYEGHGMSPRRAAAAAAEVMMTPESALAVHTREELGVNPDELGQPLGAAAMSFVCFLVGALLPVVPWLDDAWMSTTSAAVWSAVLGVVAAAIVGYLVGRFAERNVWKRVARQVAIMIIACTATFVVGKLLGVSVS